MEMHLPNMVLYMGGTKLSILKVHRRDLERHNLERHNLERHNLERHSLECDIITNAT